MANGVRRREILFMRAKRLEVFAAPDEFIPDPQLHEQEPTAAPKNIAELLKEELWEIVCQSTYL